jgi:hypothetical protein
LPSRVTTSYRSPVFGLFIQNALVQTEINNFCRKIGHVEEAIFPLTTHAGKSIFWVVAPVCCLIKSIQIINLQPSGGNDEKKFRKAPKGRPERNSDTFEYYRLKNILGRVGVDPHQSAGADRSSGAHAKAGGEKLLKGYEIWSGLLLSL